MKITNLILPLFLLLSLVSFAQEPYSEIIYNAYATQKLETKDKKSNSLDVINKAIENNKVEFGLLFNDTESLYEMQNKISPNDIQLKIAQTLLGGRRKYYSNSERNEHFKEEKAYGETFLIPTDKYEWKLHEETKKIGNYVCYKATTSYEIVNERGSFNKKVVAWYSPKISGSYGPRGFYGLPGVILEVIDGKQKLRATKISLKTVNRKLKKPTKGIKISVEEFNALSKKFVRKGKG